MFMKMLVKSLCKRSEINALEAVEIFTYIDASKITEPIEYEPKVIMFIYMPSNRVGNLMKNGNVMAIPFG